MHNNCTLSLSIRTKLLTFLSVMNSWFLCVCVCACMHTQVAGGPMDGSPPGSTIHGIFQARIPECVAMVSSRGIFPTQGSNLHLLHLLHWQTNSLPLCHLKGSKILSSHANWPSTIDPAFSKYFMLVSPVFQTEHPNCILNRIRSWMVEQSPKLNLWNKSWVEIKAGSILS